MIDLKHLLLNLHMVYIEDQPQIIFEMNENNARHFTMNHSKTLPMGCIMIDINNTAIITN